MFCLVPALPGCPVPEGFLLRAAYQPQLKATAHLVWSHLLGQSMISIPDTRASAACR